MSEYDRVAACQFEPVVGGVDRNLESMARLLDSCSGVDLAVFPELCVTGYALDVARERATEVPGLLTTRLAALAAEHETALVAGVPERADDGLYNSLVLVDGDGVQAVYRKQYPWGDETDVFREATDPVVAETPLGRVGFLVCYDLNFPEAALAYAREDCDVLVVSAAWRESYCADWELLLRARALDGACYTVGVNHVGDQRGRQHAGNSLVANPRGAVVSRADPGQVETIVTARVHRESIDHGRRLNPVHDTRTERANER
ncbi:carbon-nitrogen hydrolase family protein [Natrialbaceae archaeon GCM10025810]|uniref:carbon-nitrogen hydrolase family protein n=1 Tax=Halovalidus salilacus TaxID=3075124 RepID=UPI0036215616